MPLITGTPVKHGATFRQAVTVTMGNFPLLTVTREK
jgi:hypothetical protein